TLPALLYADKVLDRLERAGTPSPVVEPPPSVVEPPPSVVEPSPSVVEPPPSAVERPPSAVEPVETPAPTRDADPSASIGERLLALVAEARESGVDPEQALRDAVRR